MRHRQARARTRASRPERLPGADETRHALSEHIVSASACLLSACLTVIGALWVVNRLSGLNTIADELLCVASLACVAACGLAYASLRSRARATSTRLERAADVCFLSAIALMLGACAVITYAVS